MSDVLAIDALRTPLGSFGGRLSDVPASQLVAKQLRQFLKTWPDVNGGLA